MRKQLAIVMGVALWAGVAQAVPTGWFTWTNTASPDTDAVSGQWEDTPGGAEGVALGDDRIRQLKYNIRLRANTEHCWDAATTTGCPFSPAGADSGRSRTGAAKVFIQNTAPTTMSVSDANGDNTLDPGRLWVDENGRAGGTTDDFELKVYNTSGAWVPALAMGRDPTSTNSYKQWDGTSWTTTTPFTATVSTATNTTADLAVAVGAPAAIALTAADPTAVTPATGAYFIHVTIPTIEYGSSGGTSVGTFQLVENDGSGDVVVQTCVAVAASAADSWLDRCSFDYYKDASLSKTYTYKLLAGAATAAGITNQQGNTITVNVRLDSKYGMRGY